MTKAIQTDFKIANFTNGKLTVMRGVIAVVIIGLLPVSTAAQQGCNLLV